MLRKIKTAVIGAGFMGRTHAEAIRRLGHVEIAAVAGVDDEEARRFGEAIGVERTTGDYRTILDDASIEAIHICTPNALHYPIAKAALERGKHVLCEKPLTITAAEAAELVELAGRNGRVNCVNHNLRYYPVVQQIRRMIESGELGEILIVQGTYSQDWLLYDTDFNWRIESKEGGPLRAMGDIGSHWMDLVQHLTGLSITALCADLATFHKTRKKPKGAIETFAGKTLRPEDYTEVPIDTDDYGAVLLELGDRARGAFTVSQVSAGCKNRFQMEIYGTKAGVQWNQEKPDELWIGQRNTPNQVIIKDPSLLHPKAATFADLPGGHSEGYDDTHKQVFRRFYRKIADPSAETDFPTFADGLRGMRLLEKVLESARSRAWVRV
ncbi:MAG TPA: Gfo/Idh/MocA family oxidoreductase [Bryobacteraceae bacterium]|nr:Gfo/Idh/MocA family oxidoreductase [Bryobacteraceae bacterium]